MTNRILLIGVAALGFLSAPAAAKDMTAAEFMKAANTDKDQTLSKAEIEAYAKKKFAEIESDKDKTLDEKELQGRLSAAGLTAADTDKDKTVDEAEFVGYAGKLFDQANSNADKTLDLKELESPAGQNLIMLLH